MSDLQMALSKPDSLDRRELTVNEEESKSGSAVAAGASRGPVKASGSISRDTRRASQSQIEDTYKHEKDAELHRNIPSYRALFLRLQEIAGADSFLILDDLYHIRRSDQAKVLDYVHRVAKGAGLWLKIGTIRHRSNWYAHGDPPIGMKLADDADDIDLDVSLEKFGVAKDFLTRILGRFASDSGVRSLDVLLTDGALTRLVVASGGVARDFLGLFRRAVSEASQRLLEQGHGVRVMRISAEDVNRAAGVYDATKQEELRKDTETAEQSDIQRVYNNVRAFCIWVAKANILLVDKDTSSEDLNQIEELVDLRLLHKIKTTETISKRQGRKYVAYMLDLSQYAGVRTFRDFEIVEFWKGDSNLRQLRFVYDPTIDYTDEARVSSESSSELGSDAGAPTAARSAEQGSLFDE